MIKGLCDLVTEVFRVGEYRALLDCFWGFIGVCKTSFSIDSNAMSRTIFEYVVKYFGWVELSWGG